MSQLSNIFSFILSILIPSELVLLWALHAIWSMWTNILLQGRQSSLYSKDLLCDKHYLVWIWMKNPSLLQECYKCRNAIKAFPYIVIWRIHSGSFSLPLKKSLYGSSESFCVIKRWVIYVILCIQLAPRCGNLMNRLEQQKSLQSFSEFSSNVFSHEERTHV